MYQGLKKSCRNVRWKTSVTQFEVNGLKNTAKAIRDIETGNYKLSPYQEFEIYEPKHRHITATRIRDRQIQRSLCDTTFYNAITKSFINDNCACQLGKGTEFAMKRLKKHLHRYYFIHKSNEGYFLKCDIHHFFESIDHEIIKHQLTRKINDQHILKMIFEIIDSFGESKGIGLGSQVSQLLALACLDGMDHYIKEQLGIKHYVRYMDDFILVHEDKKYLIKCLADIKRYIGKLGLALNNKTAIQKIDKGIIFLNWRYIMTESGKVVMIPNAKKLTKKRRKIKAMCRKVGKGELTYSAIDQTVEGMIAHLSKGHSKKAIAQLNSLAVYERG